MHHARSNCTCAEGLHFSAFHLFMYMYTYMPNYASLGQGQHVFPLPVSTIPQMYNVNTCPIGFSLLVSSNITTCIYIIYVASVPGLPLTCAFYLPTPAQLKRARKGKAWNRGYNLCMYIVVAVPKQDSMSECCSCLGTATGYLCN